MVTKKTYKSGYSILLAVFLGVFAMHATAQTTDLPYPTDTIQDTVVYRYPAPKSIGIYRISKNFGVSQEDILRWNPQLRERGPQLDEILLIPAGPVVSKETKKEEQPSTEENRAVADHTTHDATPPATQGDEDSKKAARKEDMMRKPKAGAKAGEDAEKTELSNANGIVSLKYPYSEDEDFLPISDTSKIWRLAVLLPLDCHSTNRDEYNDRFYDFYTGLLTAVYQAQKAGMRLDIHTYDVPRTGNQLASVLNDKWIETAHAIIGPAYTNQVNKMATWSREHPIWLLVPFTSRVSGIEDNPYILQFNPTSDRKARCLADTIAQHKESVHCIYVKADRRPSAEVAHLLNELKEREIEVDAVPLRALMADSADYATRDSVNNLVILHTDNYSNASVILPHVKQLAIRHEVRLVAQDSWVQQEEVAVLRPVYAYFFRQPDAKAPVTMTYNWLHNHYFSNDSVYTPAIDYPRFDMLGYDLTKYLLRLLPDLYENATGTDTDADVDYIFDEPFTDGVQSKVRFVRTGVDGGWINEYIQVAY